LTNHELKLKQQAYILLCLHPTYYAIWRDGDTVEIEGGLDYLLDGIPDDAFVQVFIDYKGATRKEDISALVADIWWHLNWQNIEPDKGTPPFIERWLGR
jgi:hypothetical protein